MPVFHSLSQLLLNLARHSTPQAKVRSDVNIGEIPPGRDSAVRKRLCRHVNMAGRPRTPPCLKSHDTTDSLSNNMQWTRTISASRGWFDLRLDELWRYRDLIMLLVRRDFLALYKQTILGPMWHVVQPLVSALIFSVIFGQIAKIPTDGAPPLLFYLTGLLGWNYFAACLTKTSDTFTANAGIFGKVYFPRLVVPISVVLISLLTFAIQGSVLLALMVYFGWQGAAVHPSPWALIIVPLLILQMAALGLGLGILISALTTRYRDLAFALTFGIQLWMYATPVVYPLSQVPANLYPFVAANPMTPIIETLRHVVLGSGSLNVPMLAVSVAETAVILCLGVLAFVRIEKTVMDTV